MVDVSQAIVIEIPLSSSFASSRHRRRGVDILTLAGHGLVVDRSQDSDRGIPFWKHAQYSLEELSQAIHQSCAMSILDHVDIVYVVRIPTYKILRASPTLGSRLPENAVSMGRTLLAGLSDSELDRYLDEAPLHRLTNATVVDRNVLREQILVARKKGYAWVKGELDESICGQAVAVKNMEGKVRGAINVSLPSETINEAEAVERYLTPLRNTAAQIRTAL